MPTFHIFIGLDKTLLVRKKLEQQEADQKIFELDLTLLNFLQNISKRQGVHIYLVTNKVLQSVESYYFKDSLKTQLQKEDGELVDITLGNILDELEQQDVCIDKIIFPTKDMQETDNKVSMRYGQSTEEECVDVQISISEFPKRIQVIPNAFHFLTEPHEVSYTFPKTRVPHFMVVHGESDMLPDSRTIFIDAKTKLLTNTQHALFDKFGSMGTTVTWIPAASGHMAKAEIKLGDTESYESAVEKYEEQLQALFETIKECKPKPKVPPLKIPFFISLSGQTGSGALPGQPTTTTEIFCKK